MKNVEIKLRAHHGMCLAFFEGKGYSTGFTARMAQILEYLEQENPTVTVVAEADCICGGCPNLTDGRCRKAALVERYDRLKAQYDEVSTAISDNEARYEQIGMEEHSPSDWESFSARVAERILSQGKRNEICGGCQWSSICKEKEALYRL